MTYINCMRVRMHRLIIGEENIPEDMVIDHINHNTRDNRRCNLRVVTKRQNSLNSRMQYNNTSGYPGVGLVDNNKWNANIFESEKQLRENILVNFSTSTMTLLFLRSLPQKPIISN